MVEITYTSTMKKTTHLNIKNDDAHKLATELADLTGESLTSAVTLALRERLARERRRRRPDRIIATLMKMGSRYAALADTGRTPEEILGYDERGLPT
jgi:antitoxin VapB